jgi:hypothetical protein
VDPIIVDTPDGGTAEFPAGTPHDVIKGALAKRFPKPAAAPAAPAERGFVEIYGDFMRDQAGWQATRALNAATGVLGGNPITETIRRVGDAVAPREVSRLLKYAYPDSQGMRDIVHRGGWDGFSVPALATQPVNLPGPVGKIIDVGVETAIGGAAFPGGAVRNTVAGFGAGVGSETAGKLTEGSRWEPAARLAGGLVGGATGAGVAEAGNAVVKGVRNTFGMNNTDQTAARVINRGFERDKVPPADRRSRIESLGEDAMPFEAGGPNTKGVLRGATAAPGEARTTVQERFRARDERESAAVSANIDKNISPKGMTGAVDELIQARSDAARPKYIAAGVPDDPALYAQSPVLQGQAVRDLIANSSDVRRALAAARRLPDYKDLPDTSMVLLDKAYKHIGDMETAARVAGKGVRARDMASLRTSLAQAIDAENPAYGEALAAFSGPSKLIDASKAGQKAFAGNMAPDAVARDFRRLATPDAQEAYLVGVAEHLQTRADARGATGIAGRVINPRDEQRLRAILPPDRFQAFIDGINERKGMTQNQRQVGINSNTTPAALEAADTATMTGDVAGAVLRGSPGLAITRALNGMGRRIADGANERVNARIAEMLTNGSPEARRALIDALEQSLLDQRIAAPGNTFRTGAVSGMPAIGQSIQPRDDRRDRPR